VFFGLALICFFNAFFYLPINKSEIFILSWFAITTFCLYLAFSLMFINYYRLGLDLAGKNSSMSIASGREFMGLLGMIVAAILPTMLTNYCSLDQAFKIYGMIFAGIMLLGVLLLPVGVQTLKINEGDFFKDLKFIWQEKTLRKFIIIFFLNALPMAITANVFSFYVELTLNRKADTGLFLACYLVAAAIGACSLFFKNTSKIKLLRKFLLISALSFACTFFIKPPNSNLFYVICAVSGMALGAEMVILSAMAVDILAPYEKYSSIFFGILSSCSKLTLALAAGIFLPLVSICYKALPAVSMADKILYLYVLIPIILKLLVMHFLRRASNEKTI
jgi:GPH family glycoside/pentoside/hexuronide:cation symporter